MEFVQGRERHYEEEDEEIIGDVAGKIPFPSSSSSSPSSQYKGAIPQPNGRWGAEAYDKHQRVWLGTLDSDEAAVTFNDRTAVEFRGRDTVTKFNQKLDLMSMSQSNTSSDVGQGDSADAGESSTVGEREHMFDKVVTPSDVGKLNRLVIPKQHAEKYFPLDTTANEKGLLLNFEDRSGKPWRFRYSYWNSSQSYVMTKGWSRFVKEKKLDAGDIVSFERGVGESFKDRLYIDWRHRPHAMDHPASFTTPHLPLGHPLSLPRSVPWNRLFLPTPTVSVPNLVHFHHQMNRQQQQQHLHHPTSYHHHHHPSNIYSGSNCGYNVVNGGPAGSCFYLKSSAPQQEQDGVVQQGGDVPIVIDSVPVVHGNATAKRVRLFGVNLECPISEQPECDILSSTTMASLSPQFTTSVHPLQLRLYNGTPLPTAPSELPNNRNQSLSFNLDT